MPYISPTLTELLKRTKSDIESRTGQSNIATEAVSFANAGNAYGLHERLHWIARNIVPHLSDDDVLLKHCEFWGVWRKQPNHAAGHVVASVVGDAIIERGTRWQRQDGVILESTESAIVTGASDISVPVQAIDAGKSGNTAAGVKLELVSPVVNVQSSAIVDAAAISGGSDIESIDSLRSRLLFRVQYPPSGGNEYDYKRWALECAGVTRAWCIPAKSGQNVVTVMFVMDEQSDIFPTASDIERVKDYITGHINPLTNQWEGKAPCVELLVMGPIRKPLNPIIRISPSTPEARAAVEAGLNGLLIGIEPETVTYLSKIRAAVSNAKGVNDSAVASPVADVYAQARELTVLGDITWQ